MNDKSMGIRVGASHLFIFRPFVEGKGEVERKRQVGKTKGTGSGLLSEVLS